MNNFKEVHQKFINLIHIQFNRNSQILPYYTDLLTLALGQPQEPTCIICKCETEMLYLQGDDFDQHKYMIYPAQIMFANPLTY